MPTNRSDCARPVAAVVLCLLLGPRGLPAVRAQDATFAPPPLPPATGYVADPGGLPVSAGPNAQGRELTPPPQPAPPAAAPYNTAPPGAARSGPIQRVLVAEVKIVGNETTKEHQVQAQLKTRKDREFDPEMLQADVRRLVSTGRFYDVKSYTQNTPQGMVVTFEVFERPTIRYIRFLGNRGLSDKTLAKQDGLEVNDPLNRYAVEEARRKLEEFYISKGYSKAQVSILEGDKPPDKGVAFVINEGFLERIAAVHFVGNSIATEARLKTQVKSKPGFLYLIGGKVDVKQIASDIERLTAYYRGLGFFNARIGRELEFNESGKWLTITFVIDEGQRYVVRNVSLVGNEKFSSPQLLEKLELRSGEYFNLAKMNRDVTILTDTYGAQGHIFADIKADPRFLEEPGQMDLVYKIQEGGVWHAGKVNVHLAGDYPHTRLNTVINRLSVRPGELIDSRELRNSERRLKASQLFEVDPSKGEPPRVAVRSPELAESIGNLAERGGTSSRSSSGPRRGSTPHGTYRGQSPD